jgi:transcriptional regulator GlxA family with amidase domain
MIQKGKKPIEVALLCGFETYVGFYKQYVKTFGYPPSQEKQIKTL